MERLNIELVIEKGCNGLWGSVNYNDNLITEEAVTIDDLKAKMKILLYDFENVEPTAVMFDIKYDVYSLFEQFDFLNISKVARHAGINPGLLRQYASGVKSPSITQAKKIEETLHKLAIEMQKASVYAIH